MIVLFARSAKPLCWGVYGGEMLWIIPSLVRKVDKLQLQNLPPPSVISFLTMNPVYFSKSSLNCMNASAGSLLHLRKKGNVDVS